MGMPSVIVTFREKGITAIERSQRGAIAMIVKDAAVSEPFTVYTTGDIPSKLTPTTRNKLNWR